MLNQYQFKKIYYKLKSIGPKKSLLRISDLLKKYVFKKIDKYFFIQESFSTEKYYHQTKIFKHKFRQTFHHKELFNCCKKQKKNYVNLFGKFYKIPTDPFVKWHTDWVSRKAWYDKSELPFFADIKLNQRNQDIKVPWEVGRCHRLSFICYEAKSENEKKTAYKKLKSELESFWQNNPCFYGVQWTNPMEVSIRAINWLFATTFVLEECEPTFLKKLVQSVLMHKKFINHYLETSLTPNNHFLADLIGLVFIEFFVHGVSANFYLLIKKCWDAFKQQLNADGSFYEGSTAYHRLNLEMLLYLNLFEEIAQTKFIEEHLIQKAVNFYLDCQSQNELIFIGDNDYGQIIFGLKLVNTFKDHNDIKIQKYPDFGLLCVQGSNFSFTLCNKNFNRKTQPTGHLHNDNLSITLKVDQKIIFYDYGSKSYTRDLIQRNTDRSIASHNSFFSCQEKFYEEKNNKEPFEFFWTKSSANSISYKTQTNKLFILAKNFDTKSLGYTKVRSVYIKKTDLNKIERIVIFDFFNKIRKSLNKNFCRHYLNKSKLSLWTKKFW